MILKKIKKIIINIENIFQKWHIFGQKKKVKMSKSKNHMLKIQKKIIKQYR
jgi:hypothetical protein